MGRDALVRAPVDLFRCRTRLGQSHSRMLQIQARMLRIHARMEQIHQRMVRIHALTNQIHERMDRIHERMLQSRSLIGHFSINAAAFRVVSPRIHAATGFVCMDFV